MTWLPPDLPNGDISLYKVTTAAHKQKKKFKGTHRPEIGLSREWYHWKAHGKYLAVDFKIFMLSL